MAILQLNEEQVRTWTLGQKDRWWFENVWKGDMPQLTVRSALTGMIIGGVLSLTNLYVGAKTGWTLGVGITSVILAFAFFKVLTRIGLGEDFTILENNCMQSIATAAGYMTGPLISSIAAYMMVTNTILPQKIVLVWLITLAVLGVLFAFPLKRRFINDEQHPFPEGRAAGIVMDALHTSAAKEGLFKAKLLAIAGCGSAFLKIFQSHAIMDRIRMSFLAIPHYLDEWIYRFAALRIGGVELRELTVRLEPDFVMMAVGGLMGIRTGVSLIIGALVNYVVLAPWMIARGDIVGTVENGVAHYGFKVITTWSLWCGVAMMTTASLLSFFSKPGMIVNAFAGVLRRKRAEEDVLRHVELPMWVFFVGIPIFGMLAVLLAHRFFEVEIWMGAIAVPLVFVFTLIAAHSTALTAITPVGAMGKLTQLTYGVIAPGNIKTNLMTAGITAEVTSNASNLLMDIKPGYMLGGKPRHQAIGHVLGILAGAAASVPVYYYLFLRKGPAEIVTTEFPMPSATVWKAVADVLTQGISNLPESARWAVLFGGLMGLLLESLKIATKGRFWLSGVGIGLAFVIPFPNCLSMFLGSLFFWIVARMSSRTDSMVNRVAVQNQESVCAGVIAGGALMGIVLTVVENFLLSG